MKSTTYSHMTDQDLLEKFRQSGDNSWLGILLERYTLLLFGVCMKYLKNEEGAKDAVQQIFLKVITELPKYKVDYFKSWLYTIARNYCLMKIRDKGKQTVEINDRMPLAQTEEEENKQLFHLMKDREYTLMNEALHELAPEQKTCIEEFYLGQKTYQQIADKTGFNYTQVKSYIQNGKRNLKILLQKRLGKS
ncbi:MAG: RNA polymerase sigma factor [Chitinophagaceae bacterium]